MNERGTAVKQWWVFLLWFGCVWNIAWYIGALNPYGVSAATIMLGVLLRFGMSYLFYQCAYVKPGIGLLQFYLWCSLIWYVSFGLYIYFLQDSGARYVVGALFIELVSFPHLIGFYILSIYLLKLNRKLQVQEVHSSDVYKKAVEVIQSAQSVQDLEEKYRETIYQWPNEFWKSVSKCALKDSYEEKKSSFKNHLEA